MKDLFGNDDSKRNDDNSKRIIRTLGFYQPFGTLMLPPYNKIETRWVREGKKPPFPAGKYLFYTTQKPCDSDTLLSWAGKAIVDTISNLFCDEPTKLLFGYAIGIADLVNVRLLTPEDQDKAFVQFVGRKTEVIDEKEVVKVQWALVCENVQRIEPFEWKFGKQGVGLVPESEISKIRIV